MKCVQRWENRSAFPLLHEREIHLWLASAVQINAEPLKKYLNKNEQARAQRYFCKEDKTRSIISRGILRSLLANYLNEEPQDIEFIYPCVCGNSDCLTSRRKPELANKSEIQFNVSHSGDLITYAFTKNARIGVDIEQHSDKTDIKNISESFFNPSEAKALRALPSDIQRDAFCQCWTRKEAYMKAHGSGLSHGLDKFEISVSPFEQPRLLEDILYPEEVSRWNLIDFKPSPNYSGALAIDASDFRLKYFLWDGENYGI
jgi:4'-phosphopantetheinyl transferase